MARIILNPGEAGDVGSSTNYDVFGSTLAETVFVDGDAIVAFDPSFNGGGDTIVIDGLAADYTASVEGSNIVLTSDDGAEITIPVGGNGITLVFNGEDERELIVGAGGLTLGDQVIPTSGEVVLDDGGITPPTPTPTPTPDTTFFLEVNRDRLTGTAGDDYFDAGLAQNQNGEQTNTLGSGDRINGGAGTDVLFAQVQDASPLNSGPGSSIRPATVDVEVAHFQANTTYNPSIFSEGFSEEILGVEINAADMDGLDEVGSVESDASLTIYNVNTLQDNGVYDDRRLTQSVRVRMDHTGNGDVITPAADLAVLFDNDYLLRDTPNPSNSSLTLQLLDIDNQINDGTPLATMPFDRLFLTVGGEDFTVDYDASNDLTGLAAYQALAAAINVGLAAAGLDTLTATVADAFTVVDPDGSPGGPATGFNIVITDSAGAALSSDGFGATGVVPPNTDYQKEVFTTPPELTETLITVDVDLYKVGRGGDGGHLVIGGMDGDGLNIFNNESSSVIEAGVEQFILHVEGDSTQNSSLAGLFSTNNTLRVVRVEDAGSATADLIIGNDQTFQGVASNPFWNAVLTDDFEDGYSQIPAGGSGLNTVNGVQVENDRFDENNDGSYDDSFLADLTSFRNLAFKDVLIFDSTAFDNDVTLYGQFTNEVVEKYLDLTDIDADPRADNGNANYAFGVGDDTLNLNFSKDNFAINGTATREDFSFTASMGDGDDLVQLQIGNGYSPADIRIQDSAVNVDLDVPLFLSVQNWYYNYVVNQYSLIDDEDVTNPDGVMAVYTGSGDDTVELWGSTAVTVRAGSGNDDVYTDNSGELGYIFQEEINEEGSAIVQAFNDAKATWVFNTLEDTFAPGGTTTRDIDNLQTDVPFSTGDAVGNLWVQVTFEGIESERIFIGNTDTQNGDVVTDLKINNAIKEAISTDRFLSSLLEAVDGPARTLIIKSMIDGITSVDDLSISFGTTTLSAQQLAAGLTAFTGISDFDDRYESVYAYQDGQGVINGLDSFNVNNNIVEGDTGEDLVVYSSNVTSTETFDINGVFTLATEQDVVMNFTAAVADEAIPEVQTVTFDGEATDDGTASVTIFNPGGSINQTYTVDVVAGDTDEEIAAAIVALINADLDGLATAVDNEDGSITLTYDDAGIDYPQADGTVTPDAPVGEIQTIDFGGTSTTDGVVSVAFAGVTRSVDIAPGQDAVAVVAALVSAFAGTTVNAVATGDLTVLQLTDTASDVNYPNATVTIQSSESSGLTFVVDTVQDGAPFGLTVTEDTDVNGAVPAFGYDIFDVTDVIGGFLADGNFANNTNDNAETATIASLNLKARGVAIIDTVEVGDGVATATGSGVAAEAARIQQIVRSLDTAGSAQDSIIITVDDDNIGHFYLVDNGASAADAVVSHLGNVELGQYDDISKEFIGNWDAMTIANFTPLTADQIVETFAVA